MAVAVRLYPASGRTKETDYHKADRFTVTKSGNVRIYRGDTCVASYGAEAQGVRLSKRPFRTDKVTFVRRFTRIKKSATPAA